MGGPIRLDLGAGHTRREGWVRLDFPYARKIATNKGGISEGEKNIDPDIACNLKAIPLPDNYADEAQAIHVIEHFYPWEATKVMKEWVRVLKPGAELAIECPCLDKIIKLFDVPNVPPYLTYWGLYGDPRLEDPLMMHRWCYTEMQLMKLLAVGGLVDLRGEPARNHQPLRDMRLVGRKPIPESMIELPN